MPLIDDQVVIDPDTDAVIGSSGESVAATYKVKRTGKACREVVG